MAKARTAYVCNECGAEFSKWQGQRTECNAWNSLSEIVLESAAAAKAPASRRAGWPRQGAVSGGRAFRDLPFVTCLPWTGT